MTQWEYGRLARFFNEDELRLTWVGPDGHEKQLPDVRDILISLNELGAEGWELVAVTEREHHDPEADTWWTGRSARMRTKIEAELCPGCASGSRPTRFA
jgi:hypothetical protein